MQGILVYTIAWRGRELCAYACGDKFMDGMLFSSRARAAAVVESLRRDLPAQAAELIEVRQLLVQPPGAPVGVEIH